MAISLSDVKKSKKGHSQLKSFQKKRVLRPWENFTSAQTPKDRSNVAYNAVMRARQIVAKNKQMIEEIKRRGGNDTDPAELPPASPQAQYKNQDVLIKDKTIAESYKIKNRKNFFGMIKDMLDH